MKGVGRFSRFVYLAGRFSQLRGLPWGVVLEEASFFSRITSFIKRAKVLVNMDHLSQIE